MALSGAAPAGSAGSVVPGDGVSWGQVRTVLWAKYRIFLRDASQSWWKRILAVLGLLFQAAFVAVGVAFAAGATLYLRSEHPEDARAAIAAGHFLVFFTLAITPALGLRANEFLDVTKLFLLPVSHRTVFAATLVGLATSPMAMMMSLALAAAGAAYATSPGGAVAGVLCGLGVAACGIATGHLLLLAWLDLFRSRKWRDFSTLVLAVAGAGIVTFVRLAGAGSGYTGFLAPLRSLAALADTLVFLPSWWGARAVTSSSLAGMLPALALPALLWWIVRIAGRVQERVWLGDIEEARPDAGVRRGLPARIGGWFPGALGAAVEKDLAVLTREPGVRIQFIQNLAFSVVPLVLGVMNSSSGRNGREAAQWAGFAGYFLVVFGCAALLYNPLGTEGAGIAHALQTPVRRSTLLLSKAIAHTVLLGPVCGALAAAAAAIAGVVAKVDPARTAGLSGIAFAEALCAIACVAGVGTILGVWLPIPTANRDRRAIAQAQQRKGGCLRMLLGFGGFAASIVVLVPVVLCFRHPMLFRAAKSEIDSGAWLALSIPLAFAWSAFVLWLGAVCGAAMLGPREEQIVGEMTRQQA